MARKVSSHDGLPANGLSVDILTERIVEQIWERLPGYDSEHLKRSELEAFARLHVELLVKAATTGRRISRAELQPAAQLGQSRALQGVPLESVVQGYQVDEHVLMDAILATADELGFRRVRQLIDLIGTVVADLERAFLRAYQQEQASLGAYIERARSDLLDMLLSSDEAHASEVGDQARLIGIDPDLEYVALAIVAPTAHRPNPPLRRQILVSLVQKAEDRILAGEAGGFDLLVLPSQKEPVALVDELRDAIAKADVRDDALVGLGDKAPRLASVGRSCRQAQLAARVALALGRYREVVTYEDVILEGLLYNDHETSEHLIRSVLEALLSHEYLVETLQVYLSCNLSLKETARRLHVHPNTVIYRLGRIEEITNRDIRRTGDLVALYIALRAHALFSQAR